MTDPTPASPEQAEPDQADALSTPDLPTTPIDHEVAADHTDPWSREAQTIAVTPDDAPDITVADAVASDATVSDAAVANPDPETAAAEGRPKRRRRVPIVLSIAAVLVILASYGAYAGVRAWTGSAIVEPESVVPASVSAFVRLDVNPGFRDKLALDGAVKKFPTGASTEDFLTSIETKISTAAGLDFTSDVKPWFNGHVGAASWTNASGKQVTLLTIASKNDKAAKAALTKVQAKPGNDLGYVISDGYVIIAVGDPYAKDDATAAAAAAKAHSLADASAFTSGLSHLSGHNLLIGYANVGSLMKTVGSGLQTQLPTLLGGPGSALGTDPTDPLSGLAGVDGSNSTGPLSGVGSILPMLGGGLSGLTDSLSKITGTEMLGASINGGNVEIRVHSTVSTGSAETTKPGTNVAPTLDAMPAGTIVGLALDGADPNGTAAASLPQTLSTLTQLLGSKPGASADGGQTALMLQALSGPIQSIVTAKVLSLSVTGITGSQPSGALNIEFQSAALAQSMMSGIDSLTGGAPMPDNITIKQSGTSVHATIGAAPGAGKLDGDSLYSDATKGMSTASVMAYINVTKLVAGATSTGNKPSAKDQALIAPVKAIAFAASSSAGSTDLLVRIVIK